MNVVLEVVTNVRGIHALSWRLIFLVTRRPIISQGIWEERRFTAPRCSVRRPIIKLSDIQTLWFHLSLVSISQLGLE